MFGYTIENAKRYWGARAIYKGFRDDYFIDMLRDRQSSDGMSDPLSDEDRAFMEWVNEVALPWLRKEVKEQGLSTDEEKELVFKNSGYELRANPNRSYGYLYIGAAELKK